MTNQKTESAIVEIRPGAGGDEAGLFASDLFDMYSQYAKKRGWGLEIMNLEKNSIGGLKEVVFKLKGRKVLSIMKREAGVHRVQRVPETESKGKIHTSTATVVALPEASPKQIGLKRSDVKIETFRASGPGGQYTNKRETAVRVTHKKTGARACSQGARSQAKNKRNAVKILQARLLERKKQKAARKRGKKRRRQMGGGKRAKKIRTYNFPQNRVTDHRINKSWHDLQGILDGNLDPIVKKLQS